MRLSILVGGVLALRQDVLKQVLAYSTISQYGYVVVMYGIGSAAGNGAAAFYVLAHGGRQERAVHGRGRGDAGDRRGPALAAGRARPPNAGARGG